MHKPDHTNAILISSLLLLAGCGGEREASHEDGATTAAPLRGPQIVQEMVVAHGGLSVWRSAPTVSFTDEFSVPGASAPTVSTVTVEQGRRRSYMDVPGTSSVGWDGERAWSLNWSSPMPPRFVAQLNYYFLNLPWLTQDPGVQLAEAGTGRVLGDSTDCAVVMMTFSAGTGDTPEDYYRLYIDPTSKRLRACDYVVTYRSLLPAGMKASPEHHLVFESHETVNGLVVPTSYTIYEAGKVLATCKVRDWSFHKPFDESRMSMPVAAVVDTTRP